jgi:hypothetical protein
MKHQPYATTAAWSACAVADIHAQLAAQRLYDSLGFTAVAEDPPQIVLGWRARP